MSGGSGSDPAQPAIVISADERLAAVRAIQQLESYTWERVVDVAIAAINERRAAADDGGAVRES